MLGGVRALHDELRDWFSQGPAPMEDTTVRRIRGQRFVASWALALLATLVFSGAALITGSTRGLLTSGFALLCLAINAYLYWKLEKVRTAARFTIQWGLAVIFLASFNDGQLRSEVLWLIGLLPMMASYLLSRRCWINATVGALTVVTLVAIVNQFVDLEQQIREETEDILVYRIVILLAYSSVSLFATITSHHQINELKKRDNELKNAQEAAQSAIEAKNRFLANMSHEIRTPMHGILGTTQLLLDCGLSPRQKEEAQLVAKSGESLLRILNNILDLSKIDAGKFRVSPRPFDVQMWCDELVETWSPQFKAQSIELKVEANHDRGQDWIADRDRLSQVVSHLLHNSLRFTSQGEVCWSFTVESKKQGVHILEMQIRDTGPGISKSDMERVFDVFERDVEADGLGAQGMGLGLTISRRILELMGAEIELMNPGDTSGACFRLRIPIGVRARAAQDTQALARVPIRNFRGLRVLVADDQELNLKIAQAHLEQLGCEVTTAIDGVQAVQAANQHPFDIILMDINMPELNGWQASRNIRLGSPHNQHTPILALTAEDSFSAKELRERGDMVDHLAKPFTRSTLKTALARHANPYDR